MKELFDDMNEDLIEMIGLHIRKIKRSRGYSDTPHPTGQKTAAVIVIAALRTHLAQVEDIDEADQVSTIIEAIRETVDADILRGVSHTVYFGEMQ